MEQAILIVFYLITLIYSIILHEISHGVAALWLGDKTAKYAGRLSLEPTRHIDPIGSIILPLFMVLTTGFAFGWAKPVPYNPYNLHWKRWGPVIVAFAGPFTNFFLATVAAISASFIDISITQKQTIISNLMRAEWTSLVNDTAGSPINIVFVICIMFIFWNVLLGTFNLVPLPPLDGSKLVFAVFRVNPYLQAFLEQWGIFFILLLLWIPLFSVPLQALLRIVWSFFFGISL
ncbi:MAG: site-2 protease family protein [Patescibacteria group bacterium]